MANIYPLSRHLLRPSPLVTDLDLVQVDPAKAEQNAAKEKEIFDENSKNLYELHKKICTGCNEIKKMIDQLGKDQIPAPPEFQEEYDRLDGNVSNYQHEMEVILDGMSTQDLKRLYRQTKADKPSDEKPFITEYLERICKVIREKDNIVEAEFALPPRKEKESAPTEDPKKKKRSRSFLSAAWARFSPSRRTRAAEQSPAPQQGFTSASGTDLDPNQPSTQILTNGKSATFASQGKSASIDVVDRQYESPIELDTKRKLSHAGKIESMPSSESLSKAKKGFFQRLIRKRDSKSPSSMSHLSESSGSTGNSVKKTFKHRLTDFRVQLTNRQESDEKREKKRQQFEELVKMAGQPGTFKVLPFVLRGIKYRSPHPKFRPNDYYPNTNIMRVHLPELKLAVVTIVPGDILYLALFRLLKENNVNINTANIYNVSDGKPINWFTETSQFLHKEVVVMRGKLEDSEINLITLLEQNALATRIEQFEMHTAASLGRASSCAATMDQHVDLRKRAMYNSRNTSVDETVNRAPRAPKEDRHRGRATSVPTIRLHLVKPEPLIEEMQFQNGEFVEEEENSIKHIQPSNGTLKALTNQHNEKDKATKQSQNSSSSEASSSSSHKTQLYRDLSLDNLTLIKQAKTQKNREPRLKRTLSVDHAQKDSLEVLPAEWEIKWPDVKVLRQIGSGSYGTVYLCEWHGNVACKQMNANNPTEKDITVFRNELRMLMNMRHNNIILFMGTLNFPRLSIVTQWADGSTLYRHLHVLETVFECHHLLDIARQIAQGMGYLHSKDVIHRDLKSNNIFLTGDFTAKIGDFGLAAIKSTCTASNTSSNPTGSVLWMAPEIMCLKVGQPNPYSFETDVYAYGMVMLEIGTRQLPFEHIKDMQIIIFRVGRGYLKPQPSRIRAEFPAAYVDLCSKCLSYAPEKRPNMAKVVHTITNIYDRMPRIRRSSSSPKLGSSHNHKKHIYHRLKTASRIPMHFHQYISVGGECPTFLENNSKSHNYFRI